MNVAMIGSGYVELVSWACFAGFVANVVCIDVDQSKTEEREFYRLSNLGEAKILGTNQEGAELIEYASNAFRSTKTSFTNEIYRLCEQVKAGVHAVAKGMVLDYRIGLRFLHASPSCGRSCFPKDALALILLPRKTRHLVVSLSPWWR